MSTILKWVKAVPNYRTITLQSLHIGYATIYPESRWYELCIDFNKVYHASFWIQEEFSITKSIHEMKIEIFNIIDEMYPGEFELKE
jgi:hypothetical protein